MAHIATADVGASAKKNAAGDSSAKTVSTEAAQKTTATGKADNIQRTFADPGSTAYASAAAGSKQPTGSRAQTANTANTASTASTANTASTASTANTANTAQNTNSSGTAQTGTGTAAASGQTAPAAEVNAISTTAPDLQKASYYDIAPQEANLKSILDAATQQADSRIDYSVQNSENELNRALEDAQQSYQTQRNQVSADEQRALDNQALYNQARGDNGGIGAAQYSAIQNTAAQSRLAINNEQTKLASDTARQIADLRAQGEFDKADQLLTLTQDYLTKLISIEQWGQQYNLSVDQINQAIDQWKAEYEQKAQQFNANYAQSAKQFDANYALNEAALTGTYNGKPTADSTANIISTLSEMGIAPDADTLKRLGYSDSEANALVSKMTASSSSSGRSQTVQQYIDSQVKQAEKQGVEIDSDMAAVIAANAVAKYPGANGTVSTILDKYLGIG